MVFADRKEAGEILAQKLAKKKINVDNAVVVGIPRGGVIVANEISSRLNIPLTVLIIKKLGAPQNAELAIGAVASFGKPILDYQLIKELDVSSTYLKKEIAQKRQEAKQREKFLNITISPEMFKDKTVIVADDGIATGQTAKLAAKILCQYKVKKLMLAVGCAPAGVVVKLKKDFDEVICPQVSSDFMAVGQFYGDFRPVEDSEVKKLL